MTKIEGLDALNRKLAALPVAVREEIGTALDDGADRVVALAKSLAPIDEGDLQSTIRREPGRHDLAREVHAGGTKTTKPVRKGVTAPAVDYAVISEFGTKEHPAQPFLFPAWRALRKAIRARISRSYRSAAKKVGV